MVLHEYPNQAEAVLQTYRSSGLPDWVIQQCLESDSSGSYTVNAQKLGNLLSVAVRNEQADFE